MENMKTIAVIESCDTKFKEAKFISDFIKNEGLNALVINTATGPAPSYNYDISREEIAESYGTPWKEMEPKSKGEKIDYMKDAVAAYVVKLYEEGKIDGIISVGGLQNTVMAANAMQKLPIGVPKLMVSTMASGDVERYVGTSDILMMPSIVDVAGINKISKIIFKNAVLTIAGMVAGQEKLAEEETIEEKPLIAASMFGVTTPCVEQAKAVLEQAGYEVLVFHATGTGGKTMESLIESGNYTGVLALSTTE